MSDKYVGGRFEEPDKGLRSINYVSAYPKELTRSCGGTRGARSSFWRHLSWCVGDMHANRIVWVIDLYCKIFRLNPSRLWHSPKG